MPDLDFNIAVNLFVYTSFFNYVVIISLASYNNNAMKEFLFNKSLWKYLISAIVIVGFELVIFQIIYLILHNYFVATTLSFIIAVVFNWLVSRYFVFSGSRFNPLKEFTLVAIASIVGLGIQLGVVYVSVEMLMLIPILGKAISICFSFFWNYWFRAKYVFVK